MKPSIIKKMKFLKLTKNKFKKHDFINVDVTIVVIFKILIIYVKPLVAPNNLLLNKYLLDLCSISICNVRILKCV